MAELRTNLLTEEDIASFDPYVEPQLYRTDLVKTGADRSVVLTLKGHQFCEAIRVHYGFEFDVNSIMTVEVLSDFEDAIYAALIERSDLKLAKLYDAGHAPDDLKETIGEYLRGTAESWNTATKRRDYFAECGDNIVGLNFSRKNAAAR